MLIKSKNINKTSQLKKNYIKLFIFNISIICISILFLSVSHVFSSGIIETDQLEKILNDKNLCLIAVSDGNTYNTAGHIPGALVTNSKQWRLKDGKYYELFSPLELEPHIQELGINNNSKVVIYFQTSKKDFLSACYITWALQYLGHKDVYFLNGGFKKWKQEKRIVSNELERSQTGDFNMNINDKLLADADYIKYNIERLAIIDSRVPAKYFGAKKTSGVKKNGHISGAVSLPALWSVDKNYIMKESLYLLERMDSLKVPENREIVVYCADATEASLNYLVFRMLLGYKKVRLYDRSMKEWGNIQNTYITKDKWEIFK